MPNLIYLKLSPKTCLYIQLQETILTHTFTYYCTMRQWILNKYLICFLIFLVWMTFFDRNNFIYQHENRTQLQVMEQERQYYEDQIKENEKENKQWQVYLYR